LTDEDFTPKKQKEYLDKLILDLMKQGKDINQILDMPFYFMIELLKEKQQPKKETSLIAAFGG
jgi:hypothetical protein